MTAYMAACKAEAETARSTRMNRNRLNREAYLGRQDWGYKQTGQSTEFLPKTSTAVEQVVSVFNKALTQFGDWFTVMLGRRGADGLRAEHLRELLKVYLQNIPGENGRPTPFSVVLTDALKAGLLESLVIFKVHGLVVPERIFEATETEAGQALSVREAPTWRLKIELVRPEDYYPDPTGRGLYEIHSCERDLHQISAMAEAGIYDKAAVAAVKGSMEKPRDQKRQPSAMNQDEARAPEFRKTVVIDEFWGTILDDEGRVVHRNVMMAVAGGKYLIRPPEPNPFWHQESPFVAAPLIRVPFSVWHRAVYDDATSLNRAINEMFNLILDGGLAAVWGIKQIRLGALEDPAQVSGGIPQGVTLAVKDEFPTGNKVIEQVTEGDVPTDAMAVFEMLTREFNQAAMTNDLKLGAFPGREVRATEVVEMSQSMSVTLDSLASDVEQSLIEPVLRKAWLVLMQHLDLADSETVAAAVGDEAALRLMRMGQAGRFAAFANEASFKVHGLSATLSRVKDFQKLMAFIQIIGSNPLALQAFTQRYSMDKVITLAVKMLNLNPLELEKDALEFLETEAQMSQAAQMSQMMGAGGQGGGGAGLVNGAGSAGGSAPAEINQIGNPLSGMGGA